MVAAKFFGSFSDVFGQTAQLKNLTEKLKTQGKSENLTTETLKAGNAEGKVSAFQHFGFSAFPTFPSRAISGCTSELC